MGNGETFKLTYQKWPNTIWTNSNVPVNREIEWLCRGGSLTEMNEMEFHDGKNEENEIHYGWWHQGILTHGRHLLVPEEENAFNVC